MKVVCEFTDSTKRKIIHKFFIFIESKTKHSWNSWKFFQWKDRTLFSIMSLRQACLCLYISILCVQESRSCFGRSSPYRGFGVCLDVWDWKCPYEEKCIETWKVCDGWADCISRRDEVKISKLKSRVFRA